MAADFLSSQGIAPYRGSGKFLNKMILILGVDASYLHIEHIDKSIKVNKPFILMNYGHISPFAIWDCVYQKTGEQLLIWFFPKQEKRYVMVVPEAVLLSRSVAQNSAVLCLDIKTLLKFVVVSDKGVVLEQFEKENSDLEKEQIVFEIYNFFKNKYSNESLELISVDPSEIDLGLNGIRLTEIKGFFCLNFAGSRSQENIMQYFKTALLVILSVYMLSSYWPIIDFNINKTKIDQEFAELAGKNSGLKRSALKIQEQTMFWNQFTQEELYMPHPVNIIETVASAAVQTQSNIEEIRVTRRDIGLKLHTSDAISLIDRLSKPGYFEGLKVDGKIILNKKTKQSRVMLTGKIKSETNEN